MAIDIKNINEITFTQSFRGYNTDEVDDFLDDLYEEAAANNKEIEELKKRIESLEGGVGTEGAGLSQDEAYSIISNAQEEADRIIENARKKAHALIESAEKAQPEKTSPGSGGIGADSIGKLKDALREMYDKQMAVLEGAVEAAPEPKEARIEKESDIPSVSFAGITRKMPEKIPAERDILSEINSIGIDNGRAAAANQEEAEPLEAFVQPEPAEQGFEDFEESQGDTAEFAFSFAEPEEAEPPAQAPDSLSRNAPASINQNEPEDPDDIIAQILRDNNRN